MSQTYDLAAIRELLAAAFSSSEINTVAFDLFPPLAAEFSSGMIRSEKIELLVRHAQQHGQLPTLLSYVKQANPYQHERFAPRLQPKPAPTNPATPPAYQAQRLQDLQNNIAASLDLLRQYETALRLEDDPRRIARIKHNIKREKETIAGYQQELDTLQISTTNLPNSITDDMVSLHQKIDALSQQVAEAEGRLIMGQQGIRQQLTVQQTAVLAHIDSRHQQTLTAVIQRLNDNQLELVDQLLIAADRQKIAVWEAQQLTLLTQQTLTELQTIRQDQPDAAQWQSMLDIFEESASWDQKLKLTLPLIPGILEYESEVNVDVMGVLNETWRRLLGKIGL